MSLLFREVPAMKIVSYYRVSTKRQGASGLGLEAQQAAVLAFALANRTTIIKSFTEVESGKRSDRPELAKAIAHARRAKATLVIAKLDRLARKVAFTSALMESGVEFKACDMPFADKFAVHIMAAVAEKEAKDISTRTTAALAAYKARGGLLGSSRPECKNNLSPEARAKGQRLAALARAAKAKEAYADLVPQLAEMRQQGLTLREIATKLNDDGFTTARGNAWSHVQVRLVLERSAV
jgi:DNA invertase Pin-like site-specific DNA recombinase